MCTIQVCTVVSRDVVGVTGSVISCLPNFNISLITSDIPIVVAKNFSRELSQYRNFSSLDTPNN